ncbi:unnamed protein product [Somion occarium]|uniref:Protein PBN1 n=1 Tax=Somion occarium TaxID=3059160 RepID=A0ABP1D0T7_9APHY
MTCSFSSSISSTKGFHTIITTQYSGGVLDGCKLNLAYTFPPDVFVDPYELRYDFSSFELDPLPNLELPVKVAGHGDSTLLLHLDTSSKLKHEDRVAPVKIPVHARYGELVAPTSSPFRSIQLSAPRGYWVCSSDATSNDTIDVIDCTSTLFLPDSPSRAIENVTTLRVPVGIGSDLDTVEFSTTLLVVTLLAYLLSIFVATTRRLYSRGDDVKRQ